MFHASWMRPIGAPEAHDQPVSILYGPRRDQGRIQVGDDERRQVGGGSNLKNAGRHRPPPGSSARLPRATHHLEQHQTDQVPPRMRLRLGKDSFDLRRR
jgi:hypothetical protein